MSCGPEKAWPTGTGFGNRSGSRETEVKCGPVIPELTDKGLKLKITLLLMKQKLHILANRRVLSSL